MLVCCRYYCSNCLMLMLMLIMGEFVWVLDVNVGVLLVLLFEGEWFLLLWVVAFISFFLCWLAWFLLRCGFCCVNCRCVPPFSNFFCVACLTLSRCFCSPLLPFSLQNFGQRLLSLLVPYGWLASLLEFSSPLCALQFRDWVFAVSVSDGIPLAA